MPLATKKNQIANVSVFIVIEVVIKRGQPRLDLTYFVDGSGISHERKSTMSEIKCFNCGHEYDHENTIFCPNCKKPKNPNIPNYPRFKGPGIMMFFWVFFVILCFGLMLSYYAQ